MREKGGANKEVIEEEEREEVEQEGEEKEGCERVGRSESVADGGRRDVELVDLGVGAEWTVDEWLAGFEESFGRKA